MRRLLLLVAILAAGIAIFVGLRRSPSIPSAAPGSATREAASGARSSEGSPPAAGIEGRVLDDARAPVVGASVCAFRHRGADASEPRCTSTHQDGTYRLSELSPGPYRVTATAEAALPGGTTLDLGFGEVRSAVDLVVARGGVEVRGTVRDIAGGAIAGARVVLGRDAVATTDTAGSFTVRVQPGLVHATAFADGYAPGHADAPEPGRALDLALTPESVLEGRVVLSGTDVPIAGARVLVGGDDERDARSDAEGRFRLRGLAPGRYKPTAVARGHWGTARESVVLGLAETASVVVEMTEASSVEGRVVDANDQGCAGATVTLTDRGTGDERAVETDGEGTARIEGVLEGTWKVVVACPDRASLAYEDIRVTRAPVRGLAWKVERGFAVRGVVVTDAGKPVPHARVHLTASLRTAPRRALPDRDVTADEGGVFHVRGLSAETYVVEPRSDEAAPPADPIELRVDRDLEGQRIVMRSSGTLEGVVVDVAGLPAASARIELDDRRITPRDDGTFTVKDLAPGEYRVLAKRGESVLRATGESALVTMKAGVTTRVKLVVEAQRSRLRGRVVDASGDAVTDAFVDAEREGAEKSKSRATMQWEWTPRAPVLTDTEGAFVLGGLAEGTYTVRAFRKGGGEAFVEGVKAGTEVTLTMQPESTMAGTIVDADGKPPERFTIVVRDLAAPFTREETFFRTGGRWSVRDLPAGDFTVSGTTPSGRALAERRLTAGEHATGVSLTVERDGKIRGRLVALDDGAPVSGMLVVPFAARGGGGGMGSEDRLLSDLEGRFDIDHVSPGALRIRTFPMDARRSAFATATVSVDVRPGQTTEVPDIRVPRDRLRGGVAGDLGFATAAPAVGQDPAEVSRVITSAKDASLLAVGDEIVAVDGHDVQGANAYLFGPLTRVPPGTKMVLGLRSGRTVTVTAARP